MKSIIRFTNAAPALRDCEVESYCHTMLKCISDGVSAEINISNLLVIDCFCSLLCTSFKHLQHQIIWMVDDIQVHFNKHMRSNDAWSLIPDVQDKALAILLRWDH